MAESEWSWHGRPVLVTGAGGFIGSHLVEALVAAGASVRAMVHYNARSDVGSLAGVDPAVLDAMEVIHSDITDPFAVRRAMTGADVVFHLAALIAIPHSYVAPSSFVQTNVGGTLHVLEAARELKTARIVHTSTSETYGSAQYVPIDEDHPLQAQSPYAASKVGADAVATSFQRSFGTPVAIIRPFNTYGPRQSARAVIPAIAAQILAGRDPVAIGSLLPVRDLTYVGDVVRAFLAVASTDRCVGSVTNIGTGKGIAIGDLARLIAQIAGRPDVAFAEDAQRIRPPESEVMQLVANAERAREWCDWQPQVALVDGLARTIDYVRNNLARYDPGRYAR